MRIAIIYKEVNLWTKSNNTLEIPADCIHSGLRYWQNVELCSSFHLLAKELIKNDFIIVILFAIHSRECEHAISFLKEDKYFNLYTW